MKWFISLLAAIAIVTAATYETEAEDAGASPAKKPRLSMFIGVDVSGSFLNGKYYEDSLAFLAHYIHSHLNGYGDLEVPKVMFVGSLGGVKGNEPKTFYPIQTFEGKSVDEIKAKLSEIFPKKENPYTDYNAFFEQIANIVKNRGLILRPISIVLISDGEPDFPGKSGKQSHDIARVSVKELEKLSRNITIRLLYTNAVTGDHWQRKVKRQRVKVWTQDALVMEQWKDPKILDPAKPMEKQRKFHDWLKDNVDFGVRLRRIE